MFGSRGALKMAETLDSLRLMSRNTRRLVKLYRGSEVILMGSVARSMKRAQERKKDKLLAADYRDSERWNELLKFCRYHCAHGEMEFQAEEDEQHMACLLCSKSFDCCGLPDVLLRELFRRFLFISVWLEI